ncbi:hypothetical protein LX97_01251 [Nonlabens dokdonensis]|uniref:Yip1 domain-containing protein n=2 Tax=Nonlabens dokdonensis TaxID=328515 RepID=L7W9R9_NONDD|nr:hypothetical protein [Nonlabens dokdonensis]AGC76591.1 hypothetical protein DDD_1464 [Nonlabens dokdonensis DSW-6]PZX44241.1 hypothetical protein LX97_01251 [Nonlabens dokdonensis]
MRKLVFFLLIVLSLSLIELSEKLLDTQQLVYSSLSEQLTKERLTTQIKVINEWKLIRYFLIPFLLIIKVSLIAAIIDMGCFLFNKKIRYKNLLNIVIKAEFIFLIVIVIKIAWFCFFHTDFILEDLQYFYPLSAINILDYQQLDPWWIYPLQMLNLFELAYWFTLAYLIGKEIGDTVSTKGLQIVASSYGVSLVIWVVVVMFLTINIS